MATGQPLNGLWQAAPASDEFPPRQGWREIRVPANWHLAGFPNYAGTLVYRRSFSAPSLNSHEKAFLRFAGVDYFAEVWLNGACLGRHEGYFAPFEFDITPQLRDENDLIVGVDSPREPPGEVWPFAKRLIKGVLNHHDCRPGSLDPTHGQDGNTGGIWNGVTLEIRPANFLSSVRITPILLPNGDARVLVTAEAHLADMANLTLHLAITPANFDSSEQHETVRLGAHDEAHITAVRTRGGASFSLVLFISEPRLWWPWDQGEQPLYWAEVTLSVDGTPVHSLRERFGMRRIEMTADRELRLNGQRVFLRGTNVIPTQWLAEYTPERIEQDLHLLRQANVNAIRVHAHVNRRELYAACDEAGILVWQDFPLQWSYDGSNEFSAQASAQIEPYGPGRCNIP